MGGERQRYGGFQKDCHRQAASVRFGRFAIVLLDPDTGLSNGLALPEPRRLLANGLARTPLTYVSSLRFAHIGRAPPRFSPGASVSATRVPSISAPGPASHPHVTPRINRSQAPASHPGRWWAKAFDFARDQGKRTRQADVDRYTARRLWRQLLAFIAPDAAPLGQPLAGAQRMPAPLIAELGIKLIVVDYNVCMALSESRSLGCPFVFPCYSVPGHNQSCRVCDVPFASPRRVVTRRSARKFKTKPATDATQGLQRRRNPDALFSAQTQTRLKPLMSAMLMELAILERPTPALRKLADSPEVEHLIMRPGGRSGFRHLASGTDRHSGYERAAHPFGQGRKTAFGDPQYIHFLADRQINAVPDSHSQGPAVAQRVLATVRNNSSFPTPCQSPNRRRR